MCVYKGKAIAERCQEIARLEHEVEELLAQVPCRSWAVAAREAREALLRRRDLRAVEALDRIAGVEALPEGLTRGRSLLHAREGVEK